MTDSAAETTPAGTETPPAQGDQPDYKALYSNEKAARLEAEKKAQEYQNRFTGLQGKYQQEQGKWTDDVSKMMNLQDQLKEVAGIREQLDVQVKTLQEQLDTTSTEKEIADSQLERLKIVTTEFPTLVPFLQDDLIPDATGDDLRGRLQKMTERLGEVQTSSQKQVIDDLKEGATPPPSGGGSTEDTAQSLLQEATQAMIGGDIQKYNTLFDQYLAKSRGGS